MGETKWWPWICIAIQMSVIDLGPPRRCNWQTKFTMGWNFFWSNPNSQWFESFSKGSIYNGMKLFLVFWRLNSQSLSKCLLPVPCSILPSRCALKVRQFQNEFMKSSFLPKYEQKIVMISALCSEGRNLDNSLLVFWEKGWLHKLILKLTDLYQFI